jgi:hypothetical protein
VDRQDRAEKARAGDRQVAAILAALNLDWAEMTIDDAEYAEFLEQVNAAYQKRRSG